MFIHVVIVTKGSSMLLCDRSKRGRDSVPSEEGLSKKKKTKVVDNDDTMQVDATK